MDNRSLMKHARKQASRDAAFKHTIFAAVIAGLFVATPTHAAIVFITPSTLANFTTNGLGVIVPGPPLPVTNVVDTPDGFKVTDYTLTYQLPNLAQNGSDITISWLAERGLNASGPADTIDHFNHLDGTVSYTPNFQLVDISLRTITTATDVDLCALHLGPLTSGTGFNQDLNCGTFSQPVGNDQLLQFFSMTFHQGLFTTATDSLTLNLPNSAESALAAPVPLPSAWALLASGLGIFGAIRRRAHRGRDGNPQA